MAQLVSTSDVNTSVVTYSYKYRTSSEIHEELFLVT